MKNLKLISMISVSIIACCFFIWGCYWAAKTISYNIFYEDMVKATIVEMVKQESLNNSEI